MGRRHRPFYRIVVIEGYKKREGKYIESLGWYDPLLPKGKKVKLNKERYDYWISVGAKPSDAVLKLILPVEEKKKLWPDKVKKESGTQNSDEVSSSENGGNKDTKENVPEEGEPATGIEEKKIDNKEADQKE